MFSYHFILFSVNELNSNNTKKRFSFVIVSRIILNVVIGGTLPSYSVLAHSQFNLKQSNPFEPREQPPKIVMVYNGKEYSGGLVGYSWEKTEVLDVIPEIISFERTILVAAERFLKDSLRIWGRHHLSTDGGTWYPQACIFLDIEHHIHSIYEKNIIERTIQYIKARTQSFDDYFPCRREMNCKLEHVKN